MHNLLRTCSWSGLTEQSERRRFRFFYETCPIWSYNRTQARRLLKAIPIHNRIIIFQLIATPKRLLISTPKKMPMSSTVPGSVNRWRALLFRAGAATIGLLLGFVFTEALLWALDISPQKMQTKRVLIRAEPEPIRHYQCYTSNPNNELMPIPDTSQGTWVFRSSYDDEVTYPLSDLSHYPWCVEYDVSPFHMRDKVYPPEPPPGVLRIVAFGDSFVFGEGVPLEKTLVVLLREHLGPNFEIINCGFPGFDTAREAHEAPAVVQHLNCNRALVVFIPNDIGFSEELIATREQINDLIGFRDDKLDRYQSSNWTRWSRLLRFIEPAIEMREIAQRSVQWYLDAYDPAHNAANLDALQADFQRLAHLPDCPAALVIYPLMVGLENDYPLAVVHEKVTQMALEAGLPVLDLAPAFAGHQTDSLWVHPSDYHPNGKAHAIAAAEIARWLQTEQQEFLQMPASPEP